MPTGRCAVCTVCATVSTQCVKQRYVCVLQCAEATGLQVMWKMVLTNTARLDNDHYNSHI
jgi:hypothetical protein